LSHQGAGVGGRGEGGGFVMPVQPMSYYVRAAGRRSGIGNSMSVTHQQQMHQACTKCIRSPMSSHVAAGNSHLWVGIQHGQRHCRVAQRVTLVPAHGAGGVRAHQRILLLRHNGAGVRCVHPRDCAARQLACCNHTSDHTQRSSHMRLEQVEQARTLRFIGFSASGSLQAALYTLRCSAVQCSAVQARMTRAHACMAHGTCPN
jgi:hypothetical protein